MKGFTLFEILLYVGIFALVAGLFTGILLVVTRIQASQTALLEVNGQLNFAIQTIQRLVRSSSNVDVEAGKSLTSIRLRVADPAKDPTLILVSNGAVEIKEGSAASSTLTTSSVVADSLQFIKYTNYPGHDSVQIDLTLSYNTTNPQGTVSRTIRSAIGRASAATFDSTLIPGSTTYDVGQTGARWRDGYFSGSVDIDGGLIVGSNASNDYLQFDKSGSGAPTSGDCSADFQRGRFYVETTNNRLYICNGAARGWDYVALTN